MNILRNFPATSHKVAATWQGIKTNWLIGLVHKFVLLLFVLSVGFLLWRWPMLPPLVPLWYSRPWGADQLAHPFWLFLLPLASILWYGVNFLVSIYITAEYLIFTQMLFLSSLLVSVLSFLALVKILFLVT